MSTPPAVGQVAGAAVNAPAAAGVSGIAAAIRTAASAALTPNTAVAPAGLAAADYAPAATPVVWTTTDYKDEVQASGPAAADGTAETVWEVPPTAMWMVDRMVVSSTSSAESVCRVYIGDPALWNLRDGTDAGNLDVNDLNPALQVPSSRELRFAWSGMTVGAVGTAAIQYRVLSRS